MSLNEWTKYIMLLVIMLLLSMACKRLYYIQEDVHTIRQTIQEEPKAIE